jgi:transketolase
MATRKSSKTVLDAIGPKLPELLGGSADLTESNLTKWDGAKTVQPGNVVGNYIYYGVREFGMSAVMNGIVLHGGLLPFGGTFLTFSDYARNAIRMAALMQIGTIFVYTHDSVGLGEDGPTHQSVEHVSSLRLIPNLETWRPADLLETAVAWKEAIERRNGPTAMALTRQNTDVQKHGAGHAADIARGGYILWEPAKTPEAIIIATGSEIGLAVKAAQKAMETGHPVRVVSMPCVERFMKQDVKYREQVLPAKLDRRLAIEAGISWYWRPLVGPKGDVLGVDRYGESAPAPAVFKYLGFTLENVLEKLATLLK